MLRKSITRRSAPVLVIFAALVLGAARCPQTGATPEPEPTTNPEPEAPSDAGVLDAGGEPEPEPEPEPTPGPPPEPAPCIPEPGAVPSDAESLSYFSDTGIADHFTSCASCHHNGTPTATAISWGPSGDLTPQGWYTASLANYQADVAANPSVTPEGTNLYRTTSLDHQGQAADATIAQEIVDWIAYMTTESPPVICDEPEPEPEPEPTPTPPVDAGTPEPEPGPEPDGVPGVAVALEFVTDPFTIPRETCVPFVTTVQLVDYLGAPADATEQIRIGLTGDIGPGNDNVTFWTDSGCVNIQSDNVTFLVGESQKSFRWKSLNSGQMTIEARPNPSSGVSIATQTQTVTD